jgi:hypothetical protein
MSGPPAISELRSAISNQEARGKKRKTQDPGTKNRGAASA